MWIDRVNRYHLGDRPSPRPDSIDPLLRARGSAKPVHMACRLVESTIDRLMQADRSLQTGFAIAAQTQRIELPAKYLSTGFCMCTIANFFVGLSRTATIFLDRQRPHLLVRSGQLRVRTGDRERLG